MRFQVFYTQSFLLTLITSTLAFEVKPANISDEELMERAEMTLQRE